MRLLTLTGSQQAMRSKARSDVPLRTPGTRRTPDGEPQGHDHRFGGLPGGATRRIWFCTWWGGGWRAPFCRNFRKCGQDGSGVDGKLDKEVS
jgi:hypothetical protein